jgi:voltage-gated potassium channel Kch
LDFSGDEIYFKNEPSLVGKSFGESLKLYEDSAVIGIARQDGSIMLNPPMEACFQSGDQVIVISEDDDTILLSGITDYSIQENAFQLYQPTPQEPEHTLILGWNKAAPKIIHELDQYVPPGSSVNILADAPNVEQQVARFRSQVKNLVISHQFTDTSDRQALEKADLSSYDHMIVLAYSDALNWQAADARTLITLLHLRDIADHRGGDFAIVSEMLDQRNRNLADVTRADDFIVSDKLTSLMIAQISENKALNAVFEDIFDPHGSEIYLKPIEQYVALDQPLNFYTILEAASRRGEVAIGYRVKAIANDASRSYGVVLNPKKSTLISFTKGDRIIVLSEG